MKLEINTNGAWRTVLHGLQAGPALEEAKAAAAAIARIDGELSRKPLKWRLASEADGRVLAYCELTGWRHTAPPDAAA